MSASASMLNAIGKIYGWVTGLRNTLYDRGIFRSYSLGAKTISIGNITTGGTGKTPLVAYVAEILADAGEKVCILTRGYGRKSSGRVLVSDGVTVLVDAKEGGDEPVELARKLVGKAVVVADADRVSAANWAREKFGVTAFVLDDGFQHRRAKRDLDIVCVDATQFFTKMLPAGNLREHSENLARADAICITRYDQLQGVEVFIVGIKSRAPNAKIFRSEVAISGLVELGPFLRSDQNTAQATKGCRFFAFCALGNPNNFFVSLQDAKLQIDGTKAYPDHHYYSQDDLTSIEEEARRSGAAAILTTSKDAIKLFGLKLDLPCYVVDIAVKIDNVSGFRDLVLSS